MTRQIALSISIVFIVWLFIRDRKLRPMTSLSLWIPLFWVIIIGSRAVSYWFIGKGLQVEKLDDYLEGSPFDRNVYIILIIAGFLILLRRRTDFAKIIKSNRWFIAFFIYCGISCFWSDYALTSFKRYTKDVGNFIMALIIITESDPIKAMKAVFARYAYISIVISVLFIKYFPELGRYYNRWTYTPVYCGITTEKNTFGQLLLFCGIFMVWELIETFTANNRSIDKPDLLTRGILLAMVGWLILMANSSTAILCLILGICILFFLRLRLVQNQVKNLGTWILGIFSIIGFFYFTDIFVSDIVTSLGRDMTLTGRTEIWRELLAQPINPLIGTGFQSFWQTPLAANFGEKYYFIVNQAHNGYLEVYLQTGLIGLFLLMAVIIAAGFKLKMALLSRNNQVTLFFSLFIVILLNNWTEASINKFSLIWFVFILVLLYSTIPPHITENIPSKILE